MSERDWKDIKLHEGAELLKKEWFIYKIQDEEFQIELFETLHGKYYAIGTPLHTDKLLIYGSSIVPEPTKALEQTIRKINRDVEHQDILHIGEDARDPDDGL